MNKSIMELIRFFILRSVVIKRRGNTVVYFNFIICISLLLSLSLSIEESVFNLFACYSPRRLVVFSNKARLGRRRRYLHLLFAKRPVS